ncbi:MAG TPA: ATP-binding protein [Acidimicrobiales bacterium]|nr:ATP-binding protein [Acidimicrobiales bacterium]
MADDRRVLRRLGSVRARATLIIVVVTGAAVTMGAFGLLGLLRASLQEGLEKTAQAQVSNIGALVRLGDVPAQLPAGQAGLFTQVVGPDGRVLASSGTLLPDRSVATSLPREEGTVIRDIPQLSSPDLDRSGPDGPYLLVGRAFPDPGAGGTGATMVTVLVAASLRQVVEATGTVSLALAGGLPVFVALVGALGWLLVGRSLRPVEAIRSEVADITARDLHRRVPEPGTADEVARLARTMNQMLDRLEASANAQRRFVADASHELRSPLAALQASLELVTAHPDAPGSASAVVDALAEAQRLHVLVEDLLSLARAEDRSHAPRQEEVDLDEIVFLEAGRRRPASRPRLDLHRVSGGRVRGDPEQLARAVRNLLDNAQRHAASTVSVELSGDEGSVTLVVGDDGPGVAPEDRERVFEPFARLDEGRDQDAGGSGLGLAITREIVVAHGGTIELGGDGGGARFQVRLPAAPGAST